MALFSGAVLAGIPHAVLLSHPVRIMWVPPDTCEACLTEK